MRHGAWSTLSAVGAALLGASAGCGSSPGAGADGAGPIDRTDGAVVDQVTVDVVVPPDGAADAAEDRPLEEDAGSDAGNVSFRRDIYPFVLELCATSACHDRQTQQNHFSNFSSAELTHNRWVNGPGFDFCGTPDAGELFVMKTVVVPGRPEESFLLEKLTSTRQALCSQLHWPRMPPPPAPPLSPERIELIRRWILDGATLN